MTPRRGVGAGVALAAVAAVATLGAGAGCGKGGGDRVRRDRDAGPPVAPRTGPLGAPSRIAAGDEVEPNDAPEQATPLPPGHVIRGTIDGEADVDVYRVDVDRAGQLRVTVGGIEGVDLLLELRDPAGAVVARSDRGPAGTVEGFPGFGVRPGAYTVTVREYVKPRPKPKPAKGAKGAAAKAPPAPEGRVGPSPVYELAVDLAPAPPPLHEIEPNDDLGTAVEVLLADTVRGWIGWSGDVDLWKLSLEGVGAAYCVDLDVGGVDGLALVVEILDAGGARLMTRRGAKGGPVRIPCVAPAAGEAAPPWHFVKIAADRSNPEATYDLRFTARLRDDDEEAEPNDEPARATPLGRDPAARGGAIRASYALGDVDRFVLAAQPEPSLLDVTVEPPGGVDLEIEVAPAPGGAPGAALATASAAPAGGRERLAGVAIPAGVPVLVTVRLAGKPAKDDGGEARPYRLVWSVAPAGDLPMPPEETD